MSAQIARLQCVLHIDDEAVIYAGNRISLFSRHTAQIVPQAGQQVQILRRSDPGDFAVQFSGSGVLRTTLLVAPGLRINVFISAFQPGSSPRGSSRKSCRSTDSKVRTALISGV